LRQIKARWPALIILGTMRMRLGTGLCAITVALFCAALSPCAHAQLALSQDPGAIARPTPRPSYPMTFSDEAAQTLGIHDGRWDAFSLAPKDKDAVPTVRGGLSGKGPNLQIILKTN
jgi:hypothetical protein